MSHRFALVKHSAAFGRGVSRRAFTLVEMLVVVAILAVLAAVVLPSATDYVQRGKSAESMCQKRQVAQAILLVAAEDNGRVRGFVGGANVPPSEFWNAKLVFGPGGNSAKKLGPLQDPRLLFCPVFPSAEPRFNYPVPGIPERGRNWPWSGYGLAAFYPPGQPGSIVAGQNEDGENISLVDFRLAAVAQPSRQILLADSFITSSGGRQNFRIARRNPREGIHLRHAGKAHVTFLDGHTESLDAAALRALTDNLVTLFDDKQQHIP
jgi:prepilin-type N-terminal cleavage/methylation domain-containing protein/prepilin-type processing-associated H-X9-DG protein